MAEKLRKGTPADIVILTAAIVAKLAEEKLVVATSISDVGLVETALAVRSRRSPGHRQGCRRPAQCVSLPRMRSSCRTPRHRRPGSMSRRFWQQLGIADDVAARLRVFRTARPRCANWRRRMRSVRSVARNRPRSSVPTVSSCPAHCHRAANSRRCTPQVSRHGRTCAGGPEP